MQTYDHSKSNVFLINFCFMLILGWLMFFSPSSSGQHVLSTASQASAPVTDIPQSNEIYSLLLERLSTQDLENETFTKELQLAALYYSQFTQVQHLFTQLQTLEWSLEHGDKNHHTDIQGGRLDIQKTVVHFDPFTAVQVKFNDACANDNPHCITAPADVLLHELLHVVVALQDPEQYIQQGGLSGVLYPYQHERSVIEKERALYKGMTQQDFHPRPLRSDHVGKAKQVACVICLGDS